VIVAASSAPLFLIVLFGLFIFLIVLPNRRKQKAAREKLSNVEVGSEVLTVGGLIGRVLEADETELKVEIAPSVVVRIARRGVATVLEPDEPEEPAEEAVAVPEPPAELPGDHS
jgi:preprotein translocase subunit YajC